MIGVICFNQMTNTDITLQVNQHTSNCCLGNVDYYYYCYYYYVYLGLVGSSSTFPREQVAPSNLRSLGLALQFLQFQAILLFAKALYCSLHITSSASLSIFSVSLLGLQLQLEQPQLETSSRSFLLPILLPIFFLFFQLSPFVSSVLNDMVCLDIKILQYFSPVIHNYTTSRFVIIPLNLVNYGKLLV